MMQQSKTHRTCRSSSIATNQPEDAELPLKPDAPPFIAWPQGDLPITLFPLDARLSFSVVHDQQLA